MAQQAYRPRISSLGSSSAPPDPGTVFGLLDRVARRLRGLHRASLARCGVPPSGYAILQALWAQDQQSPGALAVHARCTRATMTSLLDSLERRALVCRKPHPQDRRSLLVALTAKGRDMRKKTAGLGRVFDCCCTGLSPEELAELHALLEKLDRSLHPGGGVCGGTAKEEP